MPNPRESFFVNILCGATAGVVGAAIGSPFYLVKTRLQSAGGAVGEQFVYKGTAAGRGGARERCHRSQRSPGLVVPPPPNHRCTGMTDGLRQIIQTSGFRGLWRGADASMLRTGIGSATQLTTYAFSKNLFARSGLVSPDSRMLIEMGGAMISGAVVAVVMNPFDVISTRLYNQNPGAPLYSGYELSLPIRASPAVDVDPRGLTSIRGRPGAFRGSRAQTAELPAPNPQDGGPARLLQGGRHALSADRPAHLPHLFVLGKHQALHEQSIAPRVHWHFKKMHHMPHAARASEGTTGIPHAARTGPPKPWTT